MRILDQFFQMLDLQLTFLLNLLIGVFAYRTKMITDKNRPHFLSLVLNIFLPAMVFNSFRHLTTDLLKSGLIVLLASFAIYTVTYFIGALAFRDFDDKKKRILHYATLVNNVGFAGQPLSADMFGDIGTIYASIYLVPHRIFMWTVGISVLTTDASANFKSALFKLIRNPSIIALILGLIRGILQIPLPPFVDRSMGQLGAAVSSMAAILIGSIIATLDLNSLFEKGVLRFTFIRLIVIPLAVLAICNLLGLGGPIAGVLTIMTAMPAGTTTALLADSYGLDEQLASKAIFVSTVLSVITVPTLMLFL